MTKEAAIEALKAKAAELAKKHGKAALHDVNDELVPLLLDVVTAHIPGEIDDAVATVAKPVIKSTLDGMIEKI